MKLTEAKLKQMILEMMYSPRNLVKDALSDPEVDPKIKDLLSTDNYDDMKQAFSLLQTLYPEKYEIDLRIRDPERAEMAAIARKGLEKKDIDTFDTNYNFNPSMVGSSPPKPSPSSKKLSGTYFGASRIDDPDYEEMVEDEDVFRKIRAIESQYEMFVKDNPSWFPQLHIHYNKKPQFLHYKKIMVHTSSPWNPRNEQLISQFHELLNKQGYSLGEIIHISPSYHDHGYKFEVY
tara:strand:+ start:55 stop:756 length:702 start_codon:yes stop_codon:yes gene_type:complete